MKILKETNNCIIFYSECITYKKALPHPLIEVIGYNKKTGRVSNPLYFSPFDRRKNLLEKLTKKIIKGFNEN